MSPDAHHEHGKRSMSDEPNAMLILYNLLVFVAFVVCLVLYHTGLGILVTSVEMTIDPYGGRECTYFVGTGMVNRPLIAETCPLFYDFD